MQITRIELENIKSYEHAEFEFGRGTIAIMGENGAGKTSIIEAVAWVLFDLLDYKKDDFLRRGSKKKGVARIEFESGLDERRYIVQRDTKTAYFVFDPKLKTRIADKKEEVTRFLWQHLGVEPGTDLESLFRRAIGVPQGTFTAIFLETPTERKKAFDKLLKVEEYRVGAMRLGRTAKFIDSEILDIVQKVARAEGELTNRKKFKKELKKLSGTQKKTESQLKKLEKSVKKQAKSLDLLKGKREVFEKAKAAYLAAEQDSKRAGLVLEQRIKEAESSKEAARLVAKSKDGFDTHKHALGMLKELERERKEREKLQFELTEIEKAILSVEGEKKSIQRQLSELETKRKAAVELKSAAKEQESLEKDKKVLETEISRIKEGKLRVSQLETRIVELQDRYRNNESQIKEVEELASDAKEAEALRTENERITKRIASITATLERDKDFRKQIDDGMCPVFSAKCLNLEPGQTLEGFLTDKFSDLTSEAGRLEAEQKNIAAKAKASRKAQEAYSRLPLLLKRREEIANDGKTLRKEQDKLKSAASELESKQSRLKEIKVRLTALEDPAGRIKILNKEVGRLQTLQEQATKAESNFERLESDRRLKVEQIETYKDLDSNWKEFTEKRDATADDHGLYLKNEALANKEKEAEEVMVAATKVVEEANSALVKTLQEFDIAEKEFDVSKYEAEAEAFRKAELDLERLRSEAEYSAKRTSEVQADLEKLGSIEKRLEQDKIEKERLDRLSEAVGFIRNTLKSAAPRVAKNYVFHVSVEANTLYREITGNVESTLRWTDDYGIELEEEGFSRPFISLSGGEQMAAALAVRLALLRQLTDIRIAFFDEPTTNMDLERRERLAEQISRITENQTFDQLFVISHDDTFESYADHVLMVGE
ncbi:MAG: SMC family ATPase [Pyrinomonadaceae bacterium]|nr:SMC family ATPase [Pyrinomonadaceae bacterium]